MAKSLSRDAACCFSSKFATIVCQIWLSEAMLILTQRQALGVGDNSNKSSSTERFKESNALSSRHRGLWLTNGS